MSIQSKLPVAFRRLAWCNLAAQSAEQIALRSSRALSTAPTFLS